MGSERFEEFRPRIEEGVERLNQGSMSGVREALAIFHKLERDGSDDDYVLSAALQLQGECYYRLHQWERVLPPLTRALTIAQNLCDIHNAAEQDVTEKTLDYCHCLLIHAQRTKANYLLDTDKYNIALEVCQDVFEGCKRWPILERVMQFYVQKQEFTDEEAESLMTDGKRFMDRFHYAFQYVDELRKIECIRGDMRDLLLGDYQGAMIAYNSAQQLLLLSVGFDDDKVGPEQTILFHIQVGDTFGNAGSLSESFGELEKGYEILKHNRHKVFPHIAKQLVDSLARRYEIYSKVVSAEEQTVYLEKAAFFRRQIFNLRPEPEHAQCDVCGKKTESRKFCSRCKVSCYCSEDCQKADWKAGHKQMCQVATSLEDVQSRAKHECPFCLEDINLAVPSTPGFPVYLLRCGHVVHGNCAKQDPKFESLDRRQCPICREHY